MRSEKPDIGGLTSSSTPKLREVFGLTRCLALCLILEATALGDGSSSVDWTRCSCASCCGSSLALWFALTFDLLKMTGESDMAVRVTGPPSRSECCGTDASERLNQEIWLFSSFFITREHN